jgi:hypothetical protein
MKHYQCTCCGRNYTETDVPQNLICSCDPLIGLIAEIPSPVPSSAVGSSPSAMMTEAGLCLFLMDASGSMFSEKMFPNSEIQSLFGESFVNRAEWVCRMAASGIFDLINKGIAEAEHAYICAIKFDTKQSVMFIKTIEQIKNQYANDADFAKFLYEELKTMKGGTNINTALEMAHSFVTNFNDGTVKGMGNYTPKKHTDYALSGRPLTVPNVRVLIYTDGDQLQQFGEIVSPFQKDEIDLLIGVFIGQENESGCQKLRTVIGKCPIHNHEQFLVFDVPQKNMALKGMFRMASGASGFCVKCQEDANSKA